MGVLEQTKKKKYGKKKIDHKTYVLAGDGCLMEGISHEACSLAGTLKLNKLIVFYDMNKISIDGDVNGWFTENVPSRFKSYGWNYLKIDGHNYKEISKALKKAQKSNRPFAISCKTTIGYGSPNKRCKASSHGYHIGEEEIKL